MDEPNALLVVLLKRTETEVDALTREILDSGDSEVLGTVGDIIYPLRQTGDIFGDPALVGSLSVADKAKVTYMTSYLELKVESWLKDISDDHAEDHKFWAALAMMYRMQAKLRSLLIPQGETGQENAN